MFEKSDSKEELGYMENEKKKKVSKNRKKICRYICCVPNFLCLISTFLICAILFIAIIGFSFFLSESVRVATSQRDRDFNLITEKINVLFTKPKIMTDSMAAAIEAGFLNFSTNSMENMKEFAFLNLYKSFERFDIPQVGIGLANANVDKYFSFDQTTDGKMKYLRRYVGLDNTTESQIYICDEYDLETLECKPGMDKYQYWNIQGSVTTRSQTIYERRYVSPYPFYCPGDFCDLFFSYTSPIHKNGEYLGMGGFYFTSKPLRTLLKKETLVGSTFIVDVQKGYLLASSNEEVETLQEIGGETVQIPAASHQNEDIRELTNYLLEEYNNDFTTVEENVHLTDWKGSNNIDFFRYTDEGLDVVIVRHFGRMHYYELLTVFSVVFTVVLVFSILFSLCCCCWVTCMIDLPLRRLETKMKKVETLDLSNIKTDYSFLGEVNSLEQRFYFLLAKLEEYVAFLPQFLKEQKEGAKISEVIESETSDSTGTGQGSDYDDENSGTRSNHSRNSKTSRTSKNSLDKVRSNNLTTNQIQERYCTLVRVEWIKANEFNQDQFMGPFDHLFQDSFIKRHSLLTDTIVKLSKFKGGTVTIIDDKTFQIGFNLDHKFSRHVHYGAEFALSLLVEGRRKGFDLGMSIVTEKCCTAVLGCSSLKNKVVVGSVVKLSQKLLETATKNSNQQNWRIVINDRVANFLSRKEFKITPLDVLCFPEFNGRHDKVFSYILRKSDELRDKEWMYQLDHKKKTDEHIQTMQIFYDLIKGRKQEKLVEYLERLENKNEMPIFQNCMKIMLKEKSSFEECVSKRIRLKKHMYNLSHSNYSLFPGEMVIETQIKELAVEVDEMTHDEDEKSDIIHGETVIQGLDNRVLLSNLDSARSLSSTDSEKKKAEEEEEESFEEKVKMKEYITKNEAISIIEENSNDKEEDEVIIQRIERNAAEEEEEKLQTSESEEEEEEDTSEEDDSTN